MQNRGMDLIPDEIYRAPNPFPPLTPWALVKKIALRIFFPPLMVWDILKLTARFIWGKAAGKRMLGLDRINSRLNPGRVDSLQNLTGPDSPLNYRKISVVTHDKARLDTIEFTHEETRDIPVEKQKCIIHLTGQADCYERKYRSMCKDATDFRCTVIGFNFRGIRNSQGTPTCTRDMVTDGIAEVQRLLDKGIKPSHICLKGHSMGGAFAALITKHFYDKGIEIRLFEHNSFSSLTNVIVGWVRMTGTGPRYPGHSEKWYGKILGLMAWPLIKAAYLLMGCEINAAAALKKLPYRTWDFVQIRSHRDERQFHRENAGVDDPLVSHWASLLTAFKSERKELKYTLEEKIDKLEALEIRSDAEEQELEALHYKLNRLKNRKISGGLVGPNERAHKYHGMELHDQEIRSSRGEPCHSNAQEYFGCFFKGHSSLDINAPVDHLEFKLTH